MVIGSWCYLNRLILVYSVIWYVVGLYLLIFKWFLIDGNSGLIY